MGLIEADVAPKAAADPAHVIMLRCPFGSPNTQGGVNPSPYAATPAPCGHVERRLPGMQRQLEVQEAASRTLTGDGRTLRARLPKAEDCQATSDLAAVDSATQRAHLG
eukprot:scaffold2871_cov381-Prasinococcus_capsulatus_cf.AAC.2